MKITKSYLRKLITEEVKDSMKGFDYSRAAAEVGLDASYDGIGTSEPIDPGSVNEPGKVGIDFSEDQITADSVRDKGIDYEKAMKGYVEGLVNEFLQQVVVKSNMGREIAESPAVMEPVSKYLKQLQQTLMQAKSLPIPKDQIANLAKGIQNPAANAIIVLMTSLVNVNFGKTAMVGATFEDIMREMRVNKLKSEQAGYAASKKMLRLKEFGLSHYIDRLNKLYSDADVIPSGGKGEPSMRSSGSDYEGPRAKYDGDDDLDAPMQEKLNYSTLRKLVLQELRRK